MTGERRHGRPDTPLAGLIQDLATLERRLRTLERPTGTEINQSVQKLQEAQAKLEEQQATLADQQAQLTAQQNELEDRVNAQMDEWFTTTAPGLIADEVALQLAAALAGDVTIGGSLTVTGEVVMPDVFATDLVALGEDRISVWVRDGGRMGHT